MQLNWNSPLVTSEMIHMYLQRQNKGDELSNNGYEW